MNPPLTPVALFAFNRADHLAATLRALSKNELANETKVHVFLDGPRNETDRQQQEKILAFLGSDIRTHFKGLDLTHSPENRGLAKSIIFGVTQMVRTHGRVIVLEDDLVTSPYFLRYMNAALDRYENDDRVISIHGYLKPISVGNDPFFMKGADCWGWATWARGWKLFEEDGRKLLSQIQSRGLEREFTYDHTYDYMGMLKGQIAGKNNSWAIRWYASAFLAGKLTLYPPQSLVQNIGFDGTGENCSETRVFDVELKSSMVHNFPDLVEPSVLAYQAYVDFFRSIRMGVAERVVNKLKKMIGASK